MEISQSLNDKVIDIDVCVNGNEVLPEIIYSEANSHINATN